MRILLIVAVAAASACCQETLQEVSARIAREVSDDGVGSIAAAVVVGDQVVWSKAYGYADREMKVPATPNHIYRTGSITKSFTAVLTAILAERGVLKLDAPVIEHLPALKDLASRPEGARPITFRHLATHTAGLVREPRLRGAASGPIAGWEEKILTSIPKTAFSASPGDRYRYSNIGFGILGLAASRAAKRPYMDLVEEHILTPLGMKSSTFILDDARKKRIAVGYVRRRNGEASANQPALEHAGRGYKVPNGGLYSTVGDLARFVAAMTGSSKTTILGERMRKTVLTKQTPGASTSGYGLGFSVSRSDDGRTFVGHGGSVAGYTAHLVFDPESKVGAILLRNYNRGATNLGRTTRALVTAKR